VVVRRTDGCGYRRATEKVYILLLPRLSAYRFATLAQKILLLIERSGSWRQ